ncbi:MAG: complex I subunit 4 family protein, partial [Opitutaceae bacterium]
MSELPLLSLIIFLPWLGALVLALAPRLTEAAVRSLALTFSFTTILLGLAVLAIFEPRLPGYQLVENRAWIEALGVRYHLGLDGMSLLLVLLTGLVAPACLAASRGGAREARGFAAFFLFLQGSALGVFLALDFFAWFIFWELSLVPAFFLIKLWGGSGATRAAYQFFVYTMAGSALMLAGFVALYAAAGTFDFETLAQLAADGALKERLAELGGAPWAWAAFWGIFAGLAVKTPLFPFHTWLPSAYAEAPTGASMFLTAVMSKMGVYGFFRVLWPVFPEQLGMVCPVLIFLALGGVVFGAFAALAQRDLKRMVAYSSVNHVSYCLLALFAAASPGAGLSANALPAALNGALLQMFNHGLSASALFFFIGALELRAGGRRSIDSFGGARAAAPVLAGMCGVAMFSSIGLPGLNGFIGEFLIFRGVFGVAPWVASA